MSIITKSGGMTTFQIYSTYEHDYWFDFKFSLYIFYSSSFAFALFLFITQKCRTVRESHLLEIEDYRQRKYFYSIFSNEDILKLEKEIEDEKVKLGPPTEDYSMKEKEHQVSQ